MQIAGERLVVVDVPRCCVRARALAPLQRPPGILQVRVVRVTGRGHYTVHVLRDQNQFGRHFIYLLIFFIVKTMIMWTN